MKKRILSLLMALALCLSLLPTMALAGAGISVDVTGVQTSSGNGESTVTLEGTIPDDNGGTKNVVLHFELNVEYVSGTTYSTRDDPCALTLASVEIDGDGDSFTVTDAQITVTNAKSGGVLEIDATVNMVGTKNYSLTAQWDNYQEHDGVKFEPWSDSDALPAKGDLTNDGSGNLIGSFYLTDDVTLTDTWTVPNDPENNVTVNLCLNGHVINQATEDKNVILVKSFGKNVKLNLFDCDDSTHLFKYNKTAAWTYVPEPEGTFEPVTVDQITDATADGTMVLVEGGCITGGKVTSVNNGGGAVKIEQKQNGAVAAFNMYGGNIVGNMTGADTLGGGGVYFAKGSFTMYGGCICGNTTSTVYNDSTVGGGGVCLNSNGAIFDLVGGTICCNKAIGAFSSTLKGGRGGGVFVGNNVTFNMSGGVVKNNSAVRGGGVYAGGGNIYGGIITGNTAYYESGTTSMGGGVYTQTKLAVFGGNVKIFGNVSNTGSDKIADNLYVSKDKNINLGTKCDGFEGNGVPEPDNGMLVGVSTFNTPTTAGVAFAAAEYDYLVDYFFSDSAQYYVKRDSASNQLKLYAPAAGQHTITVLPAANGAVYASTQMMADDDNTNDRLVVFYVYPDSGYILKSLKYNDGEDHDIAPDAEGKYKFTMPTGKNVTVTPVFAKAYPIWIGNINDEANPGIQVTAGDVLGDGTVIYTPDADEPDTKGTLKLNNAKIATGENDGVGAGIMVGDENHTFTELTIELCGNNNQIGKTVAHFPEELEEGDYSVGYGIHAYGGVTFTGEGNLTIYDINTGIMASSAESLQSGQKAVSFGTETQPFTGTVTIESYTPNESYGAIITDGGVTLNGGTVNLATKVGCGVVVQGTDGVKINGGKLNIRECGNVGVSSHDVTITDGEVGITAYLAGLYSESGSVTINGGEVSAAAGAYGIFSKNVVISGDDTEVNANGAVIGIGATSVAISGGTVEATSPGGHGIYSQTNVTISGNKTDVTVNAPNYGIYGGTNVNISGGKLTVTSGEDGIYTPDVVISGGNVDVTSNNKDGIMATSNDVVITGGTVTATSNADDYNGIAAENGNVTISGGTVTATGKSAGILAKNVSITGGKVTGNGRIHAYLGTLSITGGTVKAKGEGGAILMQGSKTDPQKEDFTIGSEEAPLKIKNAQVLTASPSTFEAITEGKGALAVWIDSGSRYYGTLKAASDSVDGGYVTIGEIEAPPAPVYYDDPTVTVPVAGDKDSVKISTTVNGSNATIRNVTSKQLDKIGTGKEVTIDLSSLSKSVTGVTFPKTTLENIAASEASGLEVKLPGGTTAVFDKTTVAAIAEQADGNNIQLVIDTTFKAAQLLTGAQKSAIQGMKSALVLEAYFTSNGKRISDFKGGEAELTVSYPTTKPVRVWYLTEAGALEEVPSSFDGKSASFVVKHFSNYVIEQLDETAMPFVDVAENTYYYDAVKWAAANAITSGTDATHFSPFVPVTRAQVVTFLWRTAGCPVVNYAMNMSDVKSGEYYTEAVRWALSDGITKGTSATTFTPDAVCTRVQIVTFLARFAGVADDATGYTHGFTDVKATDYFNNAVAWAKDNKVTEGTSATTFSPNDDCTRAQVVTFLYRWMVK